MCHQGPARAVPHAPIHPAVSERILLQQHVRVAIFFVHLHTPPAGCSTPRPSSTPQTTHFTSTPSSSPTSSLTSAAARSSEQSAGRFATRYCAGCACSTAYHYKTLQHTITQAEADLAAALYSTYRSFMLRRGPGREGPVRLDVGVITPYREQRACLTKAFKNALGNNGAQEVRWFAGCAQKRKPNQNRWRSKRSTVSRAGKRM